MDLHSEAVAKALKINIQFAKDMADKPKDEEVKKQQWYTIIKHLVEVKKDIKGYEYANHGPLLLSLHGFELFSYLSMENHFLTESCPPLPALAFSFLGVCFLYLFRAMACLGQCHLMTIEDIIRFLPDNSKIQDFSEEICACLEESNRRVFELKQEMKKSTMASELIQKDIHKLQKRVSQDPSFTRFVLPSPIPFPSLMFLQVSSAWPPSRS